MRKEIIVAIILGLVVGLSIAYVFYNSQAEDQIQLENEQLETTPAPSISDELGTNLSILSPEEESIVDQPEIKVAGSTYVNAFVVILVNNEDYLTRTDETGNFSIDVSLESGSNIISVTAVNEDGEQTSKEVTVVYTTQELTAESPAATASSAQEDE